MGMSAYPLPTYIQANRSLDEKFLGNSDDARKWISLEMLERLMVSVVIVPDWSNSILRRLRMRVLLLLEVTFRLYGFRAEG
jgi:hypothetical protein